MMNAATYITAFALLTVCLLEGKPGKEEIKYLLVSGTSVFIMFIKKNMEKKSIIIWSSTVVTRQRVRFYAYMNVENFLR